MRRYSHLVGQVSSTVNINQMAQLRPASLDVRNRPDRSDNRQLPVSRNNAVKDGSFFLLQTSRASLRTRLFVCAPKGLEEHEQP